MLISLRIYLSCQDLFPGPFITKHDFSILYESLCMKIWVTFEEALLDECRGSILRAERGFLGPWEENLAYLVPQNSSLDVVCVICSRHPEASVFILS
jgi:hypothetical protein